MSRWSSSTHTAYHHCMVVLSWTSLADSLLPWRLPLIMFSDEFGGSQETAILELCIKLNILTVFSTNLYVYLTVFQERHESNSYFLQEFFQQSLLCLQIHETVLQGRLCSSLLHPGRTIVGHNSVQMICGLFSCR